MKADPMKSRFLVACPADDMAIASLSLGPYPYSATNKDIAAFYRKHRKLKVREVDGSEMTDLIIAGIRAQKE